MQESSKPTPYAVFCDGDARDVKCNGGARIFLTEKEYDRQMKESDRRWKCPRCHGNATFDDVNYETHMETN